MGTDQILGLATGIVFGFLLQKGRVLRFEKQIGAMLLKDMTILKFMLSAIIVGMGAWAIPGNLFGSDSTDAFIFATIPVIIFYLSCQKYIIKGMVEGSIK